MACKLKLNSNNKLINISAIQSMQYLLESNNLIEYSSALKALIDIYQRNIVHRPIQTKTLIQAARKWGALVNSRLNDGMWVDNPIDVDLYWLQFSRLGINIRIFTRYSVCLLIETHNNQIKIDNLPTMHGRRRLNTRSKAYWGHWIEIESNFYGQIWKSDTVRNRFILRTPRGQSYYPNNTIGSIIPRRKILLWLNRIKSEVILD